MDIVNAVDGVNILLVSFREPMAFSGKDIVMLGVLAIEIVVAEANEGWGDLAKLFEPTGEAFALRVVVEIV